MARLMWVLLVLAAALLLIVAFGSLVVALTEPSYERSKASLEDELKKKRVSRYIDELRRPATIEIAPQAGAASAPAETADEAPSAY